LETFGNPIIHFGPVGSGEMIKVLGNAAIHASFILLCEIVGLGVKADVDARLLLDYLGKIPLVNHFIENTIPHYMETGTGSMMLLEPCLKDAESILQLGQEFAVPMLMQSITHDYYRWAQCFGSKDCPWDGEVLKLWESLIGRPIRDK
jgi:3-hydroxyisobutyrate dehydrogenase-like beta-hydroxyacid dehydrogenase